MFVKMVKLFNDQKSLRCTHCEKDLFESPGKSIIVFIEGVGTKEIIDIYPCCKGECDEVLRRNRQQDGYIDGWKDLTDYMNPVLYLKQVMAIINKMHGGTKLADNAIEEYKNILLSVAPYVMREPTDKEKKQVVDDAMYSF